MSDRVGTAAPAPLDFGNVGRTAWHRRGAFASQTFYVAIAFMLIAATVATPPPASSARARS